MQNPSRVAVSTCLSVLLALAIVWRADSSIDPNPDVYYPPPCFPDPDNPCCNTCLEFCEPSGSSESPGALYVSERNSLHLMIGLGGARRPGLLPGGTLILHLASLPTGPDTSALRLYPSIAPSIILNANDSLFYAKGRVRVRSRAGDIVMFERGTGYGLPESQSWVPVSHELRSQGIALTLFSPPQNGILAKLSYGDGKFDVFGTNGRLLSTGRDGQIIHTLADSGIEIVYDAEGYPLLQSEEQLW